MATKPWTDFVNFSGDEVIGGDFSSTSLAHTQNLAAAASYNVTGHQFTIPQVPDGTYFLILRTDAFNNVYEGNGESDNTHTTTIQLTVQ